MKIRIALIFYIFIASPTFCQVKRLTRSGTIEYEKVVNMYAVLKRMITNENASLFKPAFEQYQQKHGQFERMKSKLTFSDNKTLFTPDSIGSPSGGFFETPPIVGQQGIVFIDLLKKRKIAQKKLLDKTYLLNDTLRDIKWKITGETREIAGFVCYRANGLVLDSLYVVAFYTYEIPISGGPESFGGLPGMILGLTIPHENISWSAKQVVDITGPATLVHPPTKGTPVNDTSFQKILEKVANEKNQPMLTYTKGFLL